MALRCEILNSPLQSVGPCDQNKGKTTESVRVEEVPWSQLHTWGEISVSAKNKKGQVHHEWTSVIRLNWGWRNKYTCGLGKTTTETCIKRWNRMFLFTQRAFFFISFFSFASKPRIFNSKNGFLLQYERKTTSKGKISLSQTRLFKLFMRSKYGHLYLKDNDQI